MKAFLCPFLDQWSMRDINAYTVIQLESVEDLSSLEDSLIILKKKNAM